MMFRSTTDLTGFLLPIWWLLLFVMGVIVETQCSHCKLLININIDDSEGVLLSYIISTFR